MDELTLDDLPELPGYISVAVAAKRHGVHKGTIYYMLKQQRKFQHAFKINTSADEKAPRPVLVLQEAEVTQVFAERAQEQRVREWTYRVKQWGRDTGWGRRNEPIVASSPAPAKLIHDYEAANPNDLRPE